VRHSRGEKYIGHSRLCVYVCLFITAFPHYCTNPDVTWRNGRGCPLVVHYWADLQSVHGFCCYGNTHVCKLIVLYTANAYSTECEMSASACTRSMAGCFVVFPTFFSFHFDEILFKADISDIMRHRPIYAELLCLFCTVPLQRFS